MRERYSFLVISIIISILFTLSGLSVNQQKLEAQDLLFGKEAPDFALSDIDGNRVSLSDFKDKVILIDFWATWCPFCRESIPILKSLYSDYKDKGLEVVGIALEYDGGRALRRFSEEKKINYTILLGNEKLAKDYSAYGVPTRFLINREGKIVKEFVGFQDKETFVAAIQELL